MGELLVIDIKTRAEIAVNEMESFGMTLIGSKQLNVSVEMNLIGSGDFSFLEKLSETELSKYIGILIMDHCHKMQVKK
jgi:serine kinase of HPr protein (carbohydrate metabolism regulator)